MSENTTSPFQRLFQLKLFRAEPLFASFGAFMVLTLLLSIPAFVLDERLIQGENAWLKPIKFQIALAIYLLTLAYYARWLPPGFTQKRTYLVYSAVVVFACLGEIVWVAGASLFGITSHYNNDTAFMASIYGLMGLFAVILTSATLVYAVTIWRYKQSTLQPAMRLAIALGLGLTFVLTIPIASKLASGTSHFVGTPTTGASIPVLRWSREVGDLRVAHFLATHAMHFVPLMGLLMITMLRRDRAQTAVWLSAIAFTGITVFVFLSALNGNPLIPMSSSGN